MVDETAVQMKSIGSYGFGALVCPEKALHANKNHYH
jgi:hypothetical protein